MIACLPVVSRRHVLLTSHTVVIGDLPCKSPGAPRRARIGDERFGYSAVQKSSTPAAWEPLPLQSAVMKVNQRSLTDL